ncbi:MAG: diheme cytochrome C [Desertifilum sp. SIO1I2]|nr:diheme cytochrome C [Desertifilum sp. SIO1I2]
MFRQFGFNKRLGQLRKWRSPLVVTILIAIWSISLGSAFAIATPKISPQTELVRQTKAVDPVLPRYSLGQQLYIENCGSCHIAIPPAVLPTQTWLELIQDPQHYGVRIQPLVDPQRLLIWNYLRIYSRPRSPEERTPYRIASSRFFNALHPNVQFPQPVNLKNCATCHLGAEEYNFRTLSPEWVD